MTSSQDSQDPAVLETGSSSPLGQDIKLLRNEISKFRTEMAGIFSIIKFLGKVGFINPGSLGTHHDEFVVALDRLRVDILAVNETWLREGEEGRAPLVPGYRLRHIPRSRSIRNRGGGVGFYVKEGMVVKTLQHPITLQVEQMWVKTTVQASHVVVEHVSALSSHAFVSCTLNIPKDKYIPRWITYRSLKDIDMESFEATLEEVRWHTIMEMNNVDEMVKILTTYIQIIFDHHAPRKVKYVKRKLHPWITDTIKLMMKTRDEAQVTARRSKEGKHKAYYKELKSIVSQALHREKQSYFDNYVNSNINNPPKLWKHIKEQVVIKAKKDNKLPSHFNDPDKLNCDFLNVPGNNKSDLSTLTYYEFHRYCNATFSLKSVNENTVLKALQTLKSQAVGVDDMSLDMLKLTSSKILPVITHIINTSFRTHQFPELWQSALVHPIPKNDNPLTSKDLRPISVLPCLSKVIERIVHNQLIQFLEQNGVLSDLQSGFRKGRGVASALTEVVDNILKAQDTGMSTAVVFLDYTRAFDTINIPLLLSKMSYYGFRKQFLDYPKHSLSDFNISIVKFLVKISTLFQVIDGLYSKSNKDENIFILCNGIAGDSKLLGVINKSNCSKWPRDFFHNFIIKKVEGTLGITFGEGGGSTQGTLTPKPGVFSSPAGATCCHLAMNKHLTVLPNDSYKQRNKDQILLFAAPNKIAEFPTESSTSEAFLLGIRIASTCTKIVNRGAL
ncbi:unnamed protein product [Colias eurytheme]|nr:unnamed protein product [Colias eurytheme]